MPADRGLAHDNAPVPHTKEPVMSDCITYVGLDTHKESIHVSLLAPGADKPVEQVVPAEPRAIGRWARKVARQAEGRVVCAYEAGPLGYVLQRQLVGLGLECQVVAPGLIPVKPGDRIKTDRRDARKLAELLRADLLTEVHPPTPAREAVRDLCRAREDAREDLHRCRQRMSKLLLRRGLKWTTGRRAWTRAHRLWLRGLRFDQDEDQSIFVDYLLAIEQLEARLETLEERLTAASRTGEHREAVAWLRCFRGIDTVTAMTVMTELHDMRRFTRPRELMAYLGLVPTEHSSGQNQRRGAITKAGNGHVRRVLIEAAWHYRHQAAVGPKLRERRRGQPARVIAIADRAQQRLCRRYRRLIERGKPHNKAVVAVARELVGFLWATVNHTEPTTAR